MDSREMVAIGRVVEGLTMGLDAPPLPELEAKAEELLKGMNSHEVTFTADCKVDEQLLTDILLGQDDDPLFDLTWYEARPARPHRKRRIRKKWLKKYGWISTPVTVSGCRIIDHGNGEIELVKEMKR